MLKKTVLNGEAGKARLKLWFDKVKEKLRSSN